MAKEEKSEMTTIAKKQLEGRGYVLALSTTREGENLIGKVRVTEAATHRTVASFVSVWKIDNMELVFGIDGGEGIARDLVNQAMNLFDLFKYVLPGGQWRPPARKPNGGGTARSASARPFGTSTKNATVWTMSS